MLGPSREDVPLRVTRLNAKVSCGTVTSDVIQGGVRTTGSAAAAEVANRAVIASSVKALRAKAGGTAHAEMVKSERTISPPGKRNVCTRYERAVRNARTGEVGSCDERE